MATLKEHISHVTSILSNSGEVSDDFQFSDQQIYFILKTNRAFLLNQKVKEGKYVSPFNYQTIPCFKLKLDKIQDCECFTSDCYALQSICNIPTIISSTKGLIVDGVYAINTLKPVKLAPLSFDEFRLSQYSKTMKDVKGWFIIEDKLYVVGYDRLAAVKIRALFDDPVEVLTMTPSCACNDDGSALCIDPYDVEFPLDSDLSKNLWSLTYDEITKIAFRMMPDLKNDAKPSYATLEKK
jgi:hypothetical protein